MLRQIEYQLGNSNRIIATLSRGLLLLLVALFIGTYIGFLGPLYATLLAVIIIIVLAMLRSIWWSMLATIAIIYLLPFATLPFKVGFTPTFLDITLLALFFIWLLGYVRRREDRFLVTPVGGFVALFIALSLLSFAIGITRTHPTANAIRHYVELLLSIAIFFLALNVGQRRHDLIRLTQWLIWAGGGTAAIATLFYLQPISWTVKILNALSRVGYPGGMGALRWIEDNPHNPMRAIGTAVDPNVLGGMMVFAVGLLAPQLASRAPIIRRRWALLLLLIDLSALYLTYSRSALLGITAALILLALLRYRRLLVYIGGGTALLMLLPAAKSYVNRLLEGLHGQDRATKMRFGEYKDALMLIHHYPWLGVGFTGSPDIELYVGVSNVYLLIAEEMGLIGLAVFLLAVTTFFIYLLRAWYLYHPDPALESLILGYGGAIAGVLVCGLFDHYLFNLVYPHMAAIFWLYIGAGSAVAFQIRHNFRNPEPNSDWVIPQPAMIGTSGGTGKPQFTPDNSTGIADFIIERFLTP